MTLVPWTPATPSTPAWLPARTPARQPRFRLHEDDFEHFHLTGEGNALAAKAIADHDIVTLNTVGIDIGSSTSHLLFARITLQREAQQLSSRFAVVEREIVWRSPIMLTPFTKAGPIDAGRLDAFIHTCYDEARLRPADIDCGAVILTGEAIKRENARAIDELFATEAGKFVCATAGHHLEATLAAHGSGAVRISREQDTCVLHVDIGGGTTKLALIDRGTILGVCAFAVGGRALAQDETGAWTRIDDSARRVAADIGIAINAETASNANNRENIAARLADVLIDYISDSPRDALGDALLLTNDLDFSVAPTLVSFSGGVAEYLFGREEADFGDIAPRLAARIRAALPSRVALPAIDPGTGIRATVIGASQFTVQVSGTTVFVSDHAALPLRNVPVVEIALPDILNAGAIAASIREGLERNSIEAGVAVAIATDWDRSPLYADLLALSAGIVAGIGADEATRTVPLVLLIEGDVARTIGHILRDELQFARPLVSIDGVHLQDLDFVDVGEMISPAGVIPLVIKSLVFH